MRPFSPPLLAVALLVASAARAGAQTTYEACYVPSVGAIYLIKLQGLPASCLAASHVAFNWSQSSALADGSVTPPKLSFDPATQAELDALITGLAAAGTINTSTNPVDWSQLKNVPADFADGVDGGGVSDHGALAGLTDDDHPQYLLGNGARTATNGFAVTGTFGSGSIPATGAGVRFMWYPGKGAFRVGGAFGSGWDDANVGAFSVAMGAAPMASGAYSMALGTLATATGDYATAMGYATAASGDSSAAIGTRTTASGVLSTALGYNTTASGDSSTALGTRTTASGILSTALGYYTTASGISSTALGYATSASAPGATAVGVQTVASSAGATAMGSGSTAAGSHSTAMGFGVDATGDGSTAMGDNTTASGFSATAMGASTTAAGFASTAMGYQTTALAYGSLVVGRYNLLQGDAGSWVPTDHLLAAGNGSGTGARANALTLLKNGNLIISGTLTEFSDLRHKEAIEPLEAGLGGVMRLRPIRYRFREGTGHPTEPRIGLAAQEVEPVFPELVARDAQGYLSLAYTDLAAVLVRAVQEQQALLTALQREVAALRAAAMNSQHQR